VGDARWRCDVGDVMRKSRQTSRFTSIRSYDNLLTLASSLSEFALSSCLTLRPEELFNITYIGRPLHFSIDHSLLSLLQYQLFLHQSSAYSERPGRDITSRHSLLYLSSIITWHQLFYTQSGQHHNHVHHEDVSSGNRAGRGCGFGPGRFLC